MELTAGLAFNAARQSAHEWNSVPQALVMLHRTPSLWFGRYQLARILATRILLGGDVSACAMGTVQPL